jgi:hypothetical protein
MSKPMSCYSVALAILIAANVSAVAQTAAQRARWQSHYFPPPGAGQLEFNNQGNDPKCASYDGSGCLWGQTEFQIDFSRVQPLVCGADHQAKWGVTGYEDPRHWCSIARGLPRVHPIDE